MKIVFTKDVPRVGKKYEVKQVSDGYALNFLIPRGWAQVATPAVEKKMRLLQESEAIHRKVQEDLLLKGLEDVKNAKIEIQGKANDQGHLFAAIHKEQLVEELKKQTHLDIGVDYIQSDPIKEIGEHAVSVTVGNKKAAFTVTVVPAA